MPVYEFRCEACGEVYEELVPSTSSVAACPACGDAEPTRLVSRFAVRRPGVARADFSRVPFESASCCGGACAHAQHR